MKASRALVTLGLTVLAALTPHAPAAPGDLDPSFGTGGKVTTVIGSGRDYGRSVAVQADGKIVVAGHAWNGSNPDFALARYTETGALDPGFGTGGKVTTPIGIGTDHGSSVAVQGDGKIVVAGDSYNGVDDDFALVRYTSTGALDPAFGTGGKVTTPIGSGNDLGFSVVVQGDGKIVVAGYCFIGGNPNFALVRYTPAGALDLAFGTGGKVITDIGGGSDYGLSVAVQSDGKIVVAGYSVQGDNSDIALVRYTDTGALDLDFGTGGKVTTPIGIGHDGGLSVAVQRDGRIVVAGRSFNGSNGDIALVRYTPTGALDLDFGAGGKVTTAIGSSFEEASSVAVQSNGKIVVAGRCFNGVDDDFALVRYTSTGALDPAFGTGGKVTTPIGSSLDYGYSVAVQRDGKLVLAGYSYDGSTDDFAVVRYLGDAPVLPETTLLYTKGDALPTAGTDPNIPAGAVWHAFGIPAIDDAGKVAFVAKWKNPAGSPLGSYGTGVFVDGALWVYAGQEVAGIAGTTFKKFRDPVISNDHLTLLATIEGPGVANTNDTVVLWVRPDTEMTVVAREGFTLNPLADGATIKAFKGVHIVGAPPLGGPTGILYTVTLNQGSGTPAVTSANDTAALLERSESYLVAREGGSATGLAVGETIESFTLLKAINGSPQQTRGHSGPEFVHFSAKLSSGRQALLEHFEGSTAVTRLMGETVGGGSFPTATWKSFGTLSDNAEDAFAMKAVITGGGVAGSSATGIFYTVGSPDDTWENVAFIGGGAGFGLTFKAFKDPVLQGSGGHSLAFTTSLVDGSGATLNAIYWTPGNVPTVLAFHDAPAPGGGYFGKFTSLAYPGGGRGPLFLASLMPGIDGVDKTNDLALYGVDSFGTLHKLQREGDVIGGKAIKTLTVLKTVSGSPGTTHAFNATGAIVSRAAFTDGSSGILKTTVP